MNPQSKYIFLDTDEDRRYLIGEVAKVRAAMLQIVEIVPERDWYTPRYHTWSLAAMLAHLNVVDNYAMFMLRLALIGIHPRVPIRTVNWFNDRASRIFRNRLVSSSCRSMTRNQQRIEAFIAHLPMDRFSRKIYHPFVGALTVERAMQEYFVFHWQGHLQTICEIEGINESWRGHDQA